MKFKYRIEKVSDERMKLEYYQLVRNSDDAILFANPDVSVVFDEFQQRLIGILLQ